MASDQREWAIAKDELVRDVTWLGFPEELGYQIAQMLGSPKAMRRMSAYIHYVKPKSAEILIDEALAICSEIEAWREKKQSEEANAKYNELRAALTDDDE